jgi:hypothetical protein
MNKKQMLIENLRYKIIKKLNENKHTPYYQFQNNARLSREVYPGIYYELDQNAAKNQIISRGHRGKWMPHGTPGRPGEVIESNDIHTITQHGDWDPNNYSGLVDVKPGDNLIRFEMRASGEPESFGARIKEALGITPKNNSDYYLGGGVVNARTGRVYQIPHIGTTTIDGFGILHPSTANGMLSPSRSNPLDSLVSYKGPRRVVAPRRPMRAGYLPQHQIHRILQDHFKSSIASSGSGNAANPSGRKQKPTVAEFHGLAGDSLLPQPRYYGRYHGRDKN